MLLRADGTRERLAPTATVLGVFPNWKSEEQMVELRAGDTLILYSDGVTEAGVESGEEFGEDGLLRVLENCKGANADMLVSGIIRALAGDQRDDVTVVAICAR